MDYSQKIDLRKTFDFFYKSPARDNTILKCAAFAFGIFLTIAAFYALMFTLIVIGDSAGNDSIGVIVFLFYCCLFPLFYGIFFGIYFYVKGSALNNLRLLLASNDSSEEQFKSLVQSTIPVSAILFDGFKLWLVHLFYMIPVGVIYLCWFGALLLMGVSTITPNSNEPPIAFLASYFVSIFCVMSIITLYQLFYSFCLSNIVYKKILDQGYMAALDFPAILSEFKEDPKNHFMLGLYKLVPALIWVLIYMANVILIYACIGIFILPFTVGLMFIIKIYIEPHILYQAWKK